MKKYNFLHSALSTTNAFMSTNDAIDWIREQNRKISVKVERINFDELKLWSFTENKDAIRHDTNKFFSIQGINIKTNWGTKNDWSQPIINQPEIGYLGFITKELNGILHFLLQAKVEPGNVNYVQLSPTLQATKSNYTLAHKGKKPAYLDYFVNASPKEIILDQLQSEQGARFLRKRNRNIIIKVEEDIDILDNFIWLTLAQIKTLMNYDNLVNMDTRTVISGIPFGDYDAKGFESLNLMTKNIKPSSIGYQLLKSTLLNKKGINSFDNIQSFITQQKCKYELTVSDISLADLDEWIIEKDRIRQKDNKYFEIIAVQVSISNREVVSWTQPMVKPAQEGLCAFICKEIKGTLHFAVQAKLECGNFDIIEFAPSVQCLTGNYKFSKEGKLPFLDLVLNASEDQILYDTIQSEEGGRFYKEQNRNCIVQVGDEVGTELPENYIWMTLNQLQTFIQFNNYINIQARSLIAGISFGKKNEQ